MRLRRWMRAKLFATTARIPRWTRRDRGVLARRALPVVVAADDEAAAPRERPVVELGVLAPEHVLRALGDVRPEAHADRAVGRHVAGRDVVRRRRSHPAFDRVGHRAGRAAAGRCVLAADDLDCARLAPAGGARGSARSSIVGSLGAAAISGGRAERPRVGDLAAQRGRRGGRRRAQVDLVARRPAAPGEVAVERPHGGQARRRRLADADARAADRLEHRARRRRRGRR